MLPLKEGLEELLSDVDTIIRSPIDTTQREPKGKKPYLKAGRLAGEAEKEQGAPRVPLCQIPDAKVL